MAEISAHTPGTFCWVELATSDQPGAVAFYRALFGWGIDEQPISQGEVYSLFKQQGKDVAAASTLQEDERKLGVPPHWNLYVCVADADATAARAKSLGGMVLAPPFDVMTHGRMAVIQDCTGALFCLWQPKAHIGVRFLDEPGALCWSELSTRDMKNAESFYTQLFGWEPKHSPASAPMPYTEFSVKGKPSIGMMPMPPQVPSMVPAFWLPYFQVAQVDADAARATALGATLLTGPQDIPNAGRFAVLSDPQGATFAIFTPRAVGA